MMRKCSKVVCAKTKLREGESEQESSQSRPLGAGVEMREVEWAQISAAASGLMAAGSGHSIALCGGAGKA